MSKPPPSSITEIEVRVYQKNIIFDGYIWCRNLYASCIYTRSVACRIINPELPVILVPIFNIYPEMFLILECLGCLSQNKLIEHSGRCSKKIYTNKVKATVSLSQHDEIIIDGMVFLDVGENIYTNYGRPVSKICSRSTCIIEARKEDFSAGYMLDLDVCFGCIFEKEELHHLMCELKK